MGKQAAFYDTERSTDARGRPTTWEGGSIRYDAKGRPRYYIRRRLGGGRRVKVATGCTSRQAALEQLVRFQANPAAYRASGETDRAPLHLTSALIRRYIEDCKRPHDGKPANTPEWARKKEIELTWWMEKLVGAKSRPLDLRNLDVKKEVRPVVDGDGARGVPPAKGRGHKIRALKHFFTWLEDTDEITPEENVARRLKAPQSVPVQKRGRVRSVRERAHVEAVIAFLDKANSARLTVQVSTGWHTTELMRFAASGAVGPLLPHERDGRSAGVVVLPKHKGGDVEVRQRVGQRCFDAARIVLEYGPFSRKWYDTAVRDACAKLNIPKFTPGDMRATKGTSVVEMTGNAELAATALRHKSKKTTRS